MARVSWSLPPYVIEAIFLVCSSLGKGGRVKCDDSFQTWMIFCFIFVLHHCLNRKALGWCPHYVTCTYIHRVLLQPHTFCNTIKGLSTASPSPLGDFCHLITHPSRELGLSCFNRLKFRRQKFWRFWLSFLSEVLPRISEVFLLLP